MNTSAIPRKCIELSNLPAKDIKSRRLFILADGKRSIEEIIRLSAISEKECMDLMQTLLEKDYLCIKEQKEKISFNSAGQQFTGPINDSGRDVSFFIEKITDELAKYIGPFATVALSGFEFPDNTITLSEKQAVISSAVDEIEGDEDKKKFLKFIKDAQL
ncbi:hypothetical protein [Desulforhopalus sp. IMCC35007]|uniref:hypothetical protein n=1 Tax=Desulforhopalus sp. IMCC35007 TaxID=2569543 RepID=UPI0010AE4352|nr:hypothetical protein [Desulforhopalus sp. IMCC35007]TKB10073.1 hypothetical protein FCL48_08910 [Desulforhopalus sp. IMCC35007]